ncbi:ornithine cyclodeaminase family protein [Candidatus Villigracilis affinis]|uniref:ornithine cyclodeaminase family protein n=1 Tax=Candidatus Villigracilis affinis TaxID=3140682 RepID=UPI001DF0A68F|nr:ornithine cyclodeaminase family protein [Anaerolineales bacterium]
MLLLTHKEIENLLDPSELLAALEEGFKTLSAGQLNVPPRNQAIAPKGLLVGMPAYMPNKLMSVKLVTIFHENIPAHQATITLFDSNTGTPIAFMDGEYITAMRTAAGAILSIKHLARKGSKSIAIVGAGVLGDAHLQMIGTLSGIEKVWIASKDISKARALAARASNALAVDSVREAVSNADIVCLCTSSLEPVIKAEWLKKGTHVSSVGYRPPGGELPRDLVETSHIFVESKVAFQAPPVGSAELQGLNPEFGTEMGEYLLGQKPGRRDENETTIYKSMGHAMEDLVTANLVYQKAIAQGIGTTFEL